MDKNEGYKTSGYSDLQLRGENIRNMPAPDSEDVVNSSTFKTTVHGEQDKAKAMGKHK